VRTGRRGEPRWLRPPAAVEPADGTDGPAGHASPAEPFATSTRGYGIVFLRRVEIYALCAYTSLVTATFDPKKNAANLKKHGVSLAEGDGVLRDPLAVTIEDESAEGEQRFVTLGANTFGSLMVVVWTSRDDDVRIISVRKPTRKERKTYEEGV
jgi:uncharacterized protein